MATEFYYRDAGGSWRKAKEVYYRDAGSWLKAKEIWYRDAGSWRKVFTGFTLIATTPSGTITSEEFSPTPALAALTINSDGSLSANQGWSLGGGNWGTPVTAGEGAGKYARWVHSTGTTATASTGFTQNTWIQVSTGRTLSISRGSIGTTTSVFTLQFAEDNVGTGATTAGTITLQATVSI